MRGHSERPRSSQPSTAPLPPQLRRLTALLLRLRPTGESDLLLDLFSRELGRLTALAKGGRRSRRRFFGLLLVSHFLEINVIPSRKGDLWLLESARLLASHLALRQDFRRLLFAGPVLELLLRAAALHDPYPGALDLALSTLARLERINEPADKQSEIVMASALVIFMAQLLKELGYGPNLVYCLHCGRPLAQEPESRLSPAGGLVCPQCQPHPCDLVVPPELIKFLSSALGLEPPSLNHLNLSPALLRPGISFLGDVWRQVTGHDLPSLALALERICPTSLFPV